MGLRGVPRPPVDWARRPCRKPRRADGRRFDHRHQEDVRGLYDPGTETVTRAAYYREHGLPLPEGATA